MILSPECQFNHYSYIYICTSLPQIKHQQHESASVLQKRLINQWPKDALVCEAH